MRKTWWVFLRSSMQWISHIDQIGQYTLSIAGASPRDFRYAVKFPWIAAWNINFHLGIDHFSFWLSVLILVVGLMALFIARPVFKAGSYYTAISWTIGSVIGLFLSADIFLFFVFWEVA